MKFEESIKVCFSKYSDFNGRASRSELWWFNLFFGVVLNLVALINIFLMIVVYLGFLLPLIAVCIRRLHDLDKSGWWYLLAIVPIANILLLVWFCMRGTVGDNRFGSDPLSN